MKSENKYPTIDTTECDLKDRIIRAAHGNTDTRFVDGLMEIVNQRKMLAKHYLQLDSGYDKKLTSDLLDEYDELLKSLLNLK